MSRSEVYCSWGVEALSDRTGLYTATSIHCEHQSSERLCYVLSLRKGEFLIVPWWGLHVVLANVCHTEGKALRNGEGRFMGIGLFYDCEGEDGS